MGSAWVCKRVRTRARILNPFSAYGAMSCVILSLPRELVRAILHGALDNLDPQAYLRGVTRLRMVCKDASYFLAESVPRLICRISEYCMLDQPAKTGLPYATLSSRNVCWVSFRIAYTNASGREQPFPCALAYMLFDTMSMRLLWDQTGTTLPTGCCQFTPTFCTEPKLKGHVKMSVAENCTVRMDLPKKTRCKANPTTWSSGEPEWKVGVFFNLDAAPYREVNDVFRLCVTTALPGLPARSIDSESFYIRRYSGDPPKRVAKRESQLAMTTVRKRRARYALLT